MNIYQPTWLYIKQNNITGLKYFGKTKNDPTKYLGSGKYWLNHVSKHGKDVTTIWCELFENEEELTEHALKFSTENDIVNSSEWANLKPENGLDGGAYGKVTQITRERMSASHKGQEAWNKGGSLNEDTKVLISKAKRGCVPWNKGLTKESDARVLKNAAEISAGKKNKPKSETHKENISKSLKKFRNRSS